MVDYLICYWTDIYPAVGFIPITGLGIYGIDSSFAQLTSLLNVNIIANITASSDGRVWMQGFAYAQISSYIQEAGIIFKSPGAIDAELCWAMAIYYWNAIGLEWDISLQDSQPG